MGCSLVTIINLTNLKRQINLRKRLDNQRFIKLAYLE